MSSIEQSGFLSAKIDEWIKKHRDENQPWFSISEKCNQLGQEILLSLTINQTDLQRLLVSLWVSRALSHFQAIVLLMERGMLYEAQIILRTLIEVLFSLVSLAKNAEMGQEFLKDDKVQQLKALNTYRNLPKELKSTSDEQKQKLKELIDQLTCEICKNKYKELKIEYIAQKADLTDYYNTIYVNLCSTVHSRIRDLESHLLLDKNEEIVQLNWGPDISGLADILLAANEALIVCMQNAIKLFDLPLVERLNECSSEFNKIGDELVKSSPNQRIDTDRA